MACLLVPALPAATPAGRALRMRTWTTFSSRKTRAWRNVGSLFILPSWGALLGVHALILPAISLCTICTGAVAVEGHGW